MHFYKTSDKSTLHVYAHSSSCMQDTGFCGTLYKFSNTIDPECAHERV